MKLLFITSECTPFIKTGGLADVMGTLPNVLAKKENDVRVILPKYRDIPEYWKEQMYPLLSFYLNLGWRRQYCGIDYLVHEGVTYYFVDNEFYFGRDSVYGNGQEEGERFGYFSRAVLESLVHIGFQPDILHANDWQTGMVCALHKLQYMDNPYYRNMRSIFTIHNLRFQGVFSWSYMSEILGLDDRYYTPESLEYYGCMSFMKGGIVYADHLSTVSPTYAQEIQWPYYGERLDGLLRARSHILTGILNGINPAEYDPKDDMWLCAHFDTKNLAGKALVKADLQRELGLKQRENTPIVSIISRLTDQKGLDLIEGVLDEIMRSDLQLVVLGKGDEHYEELFSWAAWRYQGRVATRIELNNPLSHRIYAASDMFLMPSMFEPSGLSQMIAMRYGSIPIVRETGGLKDSVIPYNKFTGEGNGFSFANYNAHEMLYTIERAVECYQDKDRWTALMRSAMSADFSWEKSSQQYMSMYQNVLYGGNQQDEAQKEPGIIVKAHLAHGGKTVPASPETTRAENLPAETPKRRGRPKKTTTALDAQKKTTAHKASEKPAFDADKKPADNTAKKSAGDTEKKPAARKPREKKSAKP